jgi:uncharacterized membrane protein
MNKEEFMRTLDETLNSFTWQEKKEIMYDYEEHFRIGLESGKSEEDLISELGDPRGIADQYKLSSNSENQEISKPVYNSYQSSTINYEKNRSNADNISVSIIAAISLLIFNLIFIVGPYLGLAGGLIGLFAGAIGAFFGGIALTFGTMFAPLVHSFSNFNGNISPTASVLFGIGTTAFGALFFIGDCYLAKYFIKGTIKYVNWNLSIIKR